MKTILVLENDPSAMKVMRRALKQYTLIEAPTAEEALLFFIDWNYQVDILVAALKLPTMSGLRVALILRSRLPSVPVILTSHSLVSDWKDQDSSDLKALGPDSLTMLPTPLQPTVLLNAVRGFFGTDPSETARTAA